MTIKPILFNTEMVRAILDGRKSCTRRIVKPQPTNEIQCPLGICTDGYKSEIGKFAFGSHEGGGKMIFCKPPYQPEDILYVRETWHKYIKRVGKEKNCHLAEFYGYKASVANSEDANEPWKPSIHMPKEAARIWLKVTDVRVERLQEIDEDGAVKEGIYVANCKDCNAPFGCDTCPDEGYNEIDEFAELWDYTIKKSNLDRYGWSANPYVFVIEFERCEKPEGV